MAPQYARRAVAALVIGHVAGMIDLAALPIWVNTLISGFGYSPAEAGALPTGFLVGVVAASFLLSRWFGLGRGRLFAPLGYLVAGVSLLAVPLVPDWGIRFALHLLGGAGVGVGLSTVHGVMGGTANPHRIFAYAGMAFGLFSIIFLGGVPQFVSAVGPMAFFMAAGATMLVAALATALFLPATGQGGAKAVGPIPFTSSVRYAIAGVTGMALIQGMVFSFLVQAGVAKGFAEGHIQGVLIALGFINLAPPVLAALLETRLPALGVARIGPLLQGGLALAIMLATGFAGYAAPAIFFAAVMIFTHTFVFGFLAREDRSGRAVAATPAMLMAGSAIAPFLGGVLVQFFGFAAVGAVAMALGLICCGLFVMAGNTRIPPVSAPSSRW